LSGYKREVIQGGAGITDAQRTSTVRVIKEEVLKGVILPAKYFNTFLTLEGF
jgi:hypothetical protein